MYSNTTIYLKNAQIEKYKPYKPRPNMSEKKTFIFSHSQNGRDVAGSDDSNIYVCLLRTVWLDGG